MKNTICAFLFLLSSFSVFSQGWEQFYGDGADPEVAFDVAQLPGGDFLILTNQNGSIIRTDELGFEIWRKELAGFTSTYSLTMLPSGNIIVQGHGSAGSSSAHRIMEIDPDGNAIWSQVQRFPFISSAELFPVSDGHIAAFVFEPDTMNVLKVGLNGDSIFHKGVSLSGLFPFGGMVTAHDSGFVVVNTNFSDVTLSKFDKDANFEWQTQNATQLGNGWHDLTVTQTSDGGYIAAANDIGAVHLLKLDGAGQLLWETEYVLPAPFDGQIQRVHDIIETPDGKFAVAGNVGEGGLDTPTYPSILLFDAAGNLDVFHHSQYDGNINSLTFTNDGGYLGVGYVTNEVLGVSEVSYAVKLNAEGVLYSNLIQGQVALEEINDCMVTTDDLLLEGWVIKAEGSIFTFYDYTDENGAYSISIDTGEYALFATPPNDLWAPCENPVDLTLGSGDTLSVDFPIQAAIECPAMQVDISRPFLRRCFENEFAVEYCNLGTIPAEDATIEVTLDSLIEYMSSTLPVASQTGNVFTFELGDVDIMECGSFTISAMVSCDAVLGESLCFEAHAYPDSICGMPFNFSGASMVARAKCDGDTSVVLELENIGTVPTSEELEYIVIEDQIIFLEGEQIFEPMQTKQFTQDANGSTWRIICEQEPNHPGFSYPTAFVEGCGENGLGTFSIGFVNEHPMADGDGFVDIDCEEVVGAFDPNDKSAMPIGYGDEHFIEPNTDVEYRIRFQNTGTDTAFNVVIRDTLSRFLDPASLRPGASSHPYEFDLTGNGIAVFTFPNIMLPDSNVNEALSHGFVSFKISQMPDLEPETVFTNSAAIYFDFNEPIITNETFHTIERDFIISAVVDPPLAQKSEVKVYPNPFSEQATFEVKDWTGQMLTLNLFDSMGRLVRQENFNGNQLVFNREELRDGIWFFQIESEGQHVGSGKLMVTGR